MSVSRYQTSLQVVQQAAVESGLGSPSVVFASTDANVILLRTLLNNCGRELSTMRPWRALLKSGSVTAAAAAAPPAYGVNALPTDFDYAIDGTFWDNTSGWLLREADPVEWEEALVRLASPSPALFRFDGNSLWLYSDLAGNTITFRYISRYWVKPTGETAPTAEQSTADTDTLYYDPRLLVAMLKLKFREARGMDTTAAIVAFESVYSAVAGREQVAPVIPVGGGGFGFRFLDTMNVPDHGYGS